MHRTVHAAPLRALQQEAREKTRGQTRKVNYSGKKVHLVQSNMYENTPNAAALFPATVTPRVYRLRCCFCCLCSRRSRCCCRWCLPPLLYLLFMLLLLVLLLFPQARTRDFVAQPTAAAAPFPAVVTPCAYRPLCCCFCCLCSRHSRCCCSRQL